MCGIFGLTIRDTASLEFGQVSRYISGLFKLSESRGKEAAGCAIRSGESIHVYKRPVSASVMIKSDSYRQFLANAVIGPTNGRQSAVPPLSMIGHTRLVTDGAQERTENNQPVVKEGAVGIHNGIVVNVANLWARFPQLKRESELDSEIIFGLIRLYQDEKKSLTGAVSEMFSDIQGSASIAALFNDLGYLLLATNTGSLYVGGNEGHDALMFASELYILRDFIRIFKIENAFGKCGIGQVRPGHGMLIDIGSLERAEFAFGDGQRIEPDERLSKPLTVRMAGNPAEDRGRTRVYRGEAVRWSRYEKDFQEARRRINALRRCEKCVLPETFPFIEFDESGICNYCNHYLKIPLKSKDEFEAIADRYRRRDGGPDCIVGLSGGRDSSFGLHHLKTELGLNPIAFSYDWGMLTDLGRRNQARMCGKLGVEHIIVSADITRKRDYIRQNVEAWLKKPDLGVIPLFMAGDKQYFYYANKLMRQYNTEIMVMAENPLERAYFKHGFCGIKFKASDKPPYELGILDKIRIAAYYGKQYLLNPSYINVSIIDTIGAYFSYYLIPHNYFSLFDYMLWDEEEIISTLREEYDWELADDTESTWRIGDGTAAFYNYIYYLVAGFTEIDTFRSNQVREGAIDRQRALELAQLENAPRWKSIEWYARTIGLDCGKALEVINTIPKLY